MDEYKSRLSTYLSDMVREELEKYDGGFTDEWNDQRKKNAKSWDINFQVKMI